MRIDPMLTVGPTAQATSLSRMLSRLSTGVRLESVPDLEIGTRVSVSLEARIREVTAGKKAVVEAEMMLQIADEGASSIVDLMERMRELAVDASSEAVSDKQRSVLDAEFQELYEELDQVASSTARRGRELLDGQFGTAGLGALDIQIGVVDANRIAIDIAQMDSGILGLGGDRIELEDGAVGITGVTARGLDAPSGTLSVAVADSTAVAAVLTGTSAVATHMGTSGDLLLEVDGTAKRVSFTGSTSASITGTTASSILSGGGELVLGIDGVSHTATLVDTSSQQLVGTPAAASSFSGSGVIQVDTTSGTSLVSVTGDTAASMALTMTGSSIASAGSVDLQIDGSSETVSFQTDTAPTLTGGVASSSTGGSLELIVDGTSHTVTVGGAVPASATSAPVSGVLPDGTLTFDLGGTTRSVEVTDGHPTHVSLQEVPGVTTSGGSFALRTYDGQTGIERNQGYYFNAGTSFATLRSAASSIASATGATFDSATLTFKGPGTGSDSWMSVWASGGPEKFVLATSTPAGSSRIDGTDPNNTTALLVSDLQAPGTTLASVDGAGALTVTDDTGGGATMTVTGSADLLAELGWTDGQTFASTTAATPTEVVDAINTQTGGAVTASLDTDGRIVLTKALRTTAAASSQTIEIGAGSDTTLATALGFTIGDSAAGTDGDDRASVVRKLDAAASVSGGSAADTGVAIVVSSGTTGTSSSVAIGASSDATIASQLGVSPGDTETGSAGESLSTVLTRLASATGDAVTGTSSEGVVTLTSDDAFSLSLASGDDVLGELGFSDGDSSGLVGDPLTLAVAAGTIQVAVGSAATVALDSGRVRITSASAGSGSSVEIGSASTATVLSDLGLTSGDTAAGTDGDTAAVAVAAIDSAVGSEATVTLDASGLLVMTTTQTGSSASLVVDEGSTSGVLSDLGLSAGQHSVGADAGTQLTATHSAGGTDTVVLEDRDRVTAFEGSMEGLRLGLDPTVDQADISGEISVVYRSPVTIATLAGATTAVERLDEGLAKADSIRSRIAAASRRLDATEGHLDATADAMTSARDRAQTTDRTLGQDLQAVKRAAQVKALKPVAQRVAANMDRSTLTSLLDPGRIGSSSFGGSGASNPLGAPDAPGAQRSRSVGGLFGARGQTPVFGQRSAFPPNGAAAPEWAAGAFGVSSSPTRAWHLTLR